MRSHSRTPRLLATRCSHCSCNCRGPPAPDADAAANAWHRMPNGPSAGVAITCHAPSEPRNSCATVLHALSRLTLARLRPRYTPLPASSACVHATHRPQLPAPASSLHTAPSFQRVRPRYTPPPASSACAHATHRPQLPAPAPTLHTAPSFQRLQHRVQRPQLPAPAAPRPAPTENTVPLTCETAAAAPADPADRGTVQANGVASITPRQPRGLWLPAHAHRSTTRQTSQSQTARRAYGRVRTARTPSQVFIVPRTGKLTTRERTTRIASTSRDAAATSRARSAATGATATTTTRTWRGWCQWRRPVFNSDA